ncbi:MAG TPA: S9 family peptidase [Allosphingosinicella sp.]|jgi:dipeptidyl aminopeptidase/acylaminoacyl peptidase|nr:S9 family peptidase [Allosphingosinicella sp.]
MQIFQSFFGHVRPRGMRAGALLLAATCLTANTPPDPAAAFGARESIEDISLSPDGRRIAYVAPHQGQGSRLFTVDLQSGNAVQATAVDGRSQRLGACGWVSGARLVCSVFALRRVQTDVTGAQRFVALDSDGSNIVMLGERDQRTGNGAWLRGIIDWRAGEGESILMTSILPDAGARGNHGLGVVRLETRSNRSGLVQPAIVRASSFLSDGRGRVVVQGVQRVRGETGMMSGEMEFRHRRPGSDAWHSLGIYNNTTRDGLYPLAVTPDGAAAFALDKLDGRTALYRVALDGSQRRELLVKHDRVDVDGVLTLGRRGRVIGATYATEARQAVYFDAELQTLAERLSRALPNLPLIRFAGASDDESVLLIWAGSDRDPGRYFTYAKSDRRLNEIMLSRPQLEGVALAEVRPVSYPAADGTSIPGYLTLPPGSSGRGLPAIVMPHGGPESRDEWGFNWMAQYFAHRGYAVLQPNFRGSAGYGDAWFHRNGFQSWQVAVGDVNDAGRWLVSQGIADPAKLGIVGWSYGGYAALQSAVLDPSLFRAIVAIAPVADLEILREESRGWSDFRLARDFIGSGAHVRAGSPAQNASAFRAPALLFHGDHDANVDVRHSRLMRDKLQSAGRPVELVLFPGLDHDLQDSDARARMLRESDAFIRRALGMQ